MTTIITLMAGVVIAGALFAATIFSLVQSFRQDGSLRWAHVATLAGTLAGMATLSSQRHDLAMVVGAFLIAAGLWAVVRESGWNRVLPLFQAFFGVILVLGLPFSSG
jgi:hypothetical protein